MDNRRKIEITDMIIRDIENDAKNFYSQQLNGKTVAKYLENQGAAIHALAMIVQSLLEKERFN